MASVYDDYFHQAHELHDHFKDIVDNHNHPQAQLLQHEVHQLAEDFKMQKDPRHMDDRLKKLDHELEQAKFQSDPFMSYRDLEDLQHRFRRMRDSVKRLPGH